MVEIAQRRDPSPVPASQPACCSSCGDEAGTCLSQADESQAFRPDWHAAVEQLVAGARGLGEQVFAGGDMSFISLLVADKEAAGLP